MDFYPEQLRKQYRLFGHKGFFTQVSCIDTNAGKQLSREVLNGEEAIIEWAKTWNGKGNLFIGRNPRSTDGNVVHSTILTLDIDPERTKGEAATPEQLQAAITCGNNVVKHFGYGIVGTSGNGVLLMFPLKEAINKDLAETYGKALEHTAREVIGGNLNVRVDSTYDFARLCKCLGTISTKGNTAQWRHAKFISDANNSGNIERFYQWLNSRPKEEPKSLFSPALPKGELDRSKADIALANRLKLQGFGAEDTYRALQSFATRPGRDDDYKRIIGKVYFNQGSVAQMVSGGIEREIELITPQSGITGYKQRSHTGVPELPTGFAQIDRATFGLTRGTLFTVGARRGAGKTTFAIGTALNLCRAGKRVLFLSTETTYQEVWDRYFAVGADVSAFAIQHGIKLNGHQQGFDKFVEEFTASHKFTVYDGSRPSVGVVRRIIEQAAPDVLIFDYFQHVEARDVKALEEFVMDLHDLAKEKQFAVLMCAQLHDRRNPQTNKPYPPSLNDMKNSKVLNDESRVVLLLDWDSEGAHGDGPAVVKAIMAKNRGPKNDVVLKLDRSIPRFTEEA